MMDPLEMLLNKEQLIKNAQAQKSKSEAEGDPLNLVGAVKESAGAFYFCRRCKRGSNRFELCAACHAVEVVQAEGKRYGKELHPHFLRCPHKSLVRRRFVNDAVPGMAHIRRIM